jgi:ketosteroid isomerase-like protein
MKNLCVVPALGLLMAVGAPAFGANLQQDVQHSLQQLEQRWNAGDHHGVAAFFGAQARLAGEGAPKSVHGKAALDKNMQELVQQAPKIRIELKEYRATSGSSAYTWLLWHIQPTKADEKPMTMRSLTVWSRQADGLKIRSDSYSVGDF